MTPHGTSTFSFNLNHLPQISSMKTIERTKSTTKRKGIFSNIPNLHVKSQGERAMIDD
jgi:hypothetical protein